MSNVGQAVLSIGGGVIGWFVGGPTGAAWGFQLGSMAGQAFFPTDLGTIRGPRLDDLRVMSSAIGAPIPIVYGTYTVAGNVIWSSGLIETVTKDKVGGKGGPTQTVKTYSYSVDLALGICEGEINGVRRIWADADLIYDISVQGATESDEDYQARLASSEQLAAQMVVYTGTETQLADPTIEGYEGAGNVPAYRGLAYLVLTGFQLEKFGNRIPNFRVEVFRGTLAAEDCTSISNEVLFAWNSGDDPRNFLNHHRYSIIGVGGLTYDGGANYLGTPSGQWTTDITDITGAGASALGRNFSEYYGFADLSNRLSTNRIETNTAGEFLSLYLDFQLQPDSVVSQYQAWFANSVCAQQFGAAVGEYVFNGQGYFVFGQNLSYTGLHLNVGRSSVKPAFDSQNWDVEISCGVEMGENVFTWTKYSRRVEVQRVPRAPLSTAEDPNYTALAGTPGFYRNIYTGQIVRGVTWTYDNSTTYKVLQKYATASDGGTPARQIVTKYPRSPAVPLGDANYDSQAFWEAAYAEAVAAGEMTAGLTYGVDYPQTQSYAYISSCETPIANTECIPVATVVQDLCARAGLTDVDVSDLSYCLEGYAVSRVMSARDAIDPLRSVALFDAVESGTVLKFVERGHPVVATLSEDDLCAHPAGESRPAAVEITRTQEKELPKSLRVHYISPTRNYEQAEQYAARITTEATGASDIELAVALSDERAAELAEILLYSTWVSRNGYRFALSTQYLKLEPTDCVYLPVDGDLVRVRITATEYSLGGLLQVEGVRDDDEVYGLTATPATPAGSGGGSTIATPICPVETVFIDIPGLRREDNDAGYYAASRSLCNTWTCATIFRSSDGGTVYARLADVILEATIGEILDTAVSPPSNSPPQQISGSPLIFDETTVIQVQLLSGTQLESVTEEQLLAGANAAVIGAHGRWEIIQFRDATLVTGDVWQLSGLWRGLNGTDANVSTTVSGDTFVLMDSAVVRLPATLSDVGIARQLKSVPCGSTLDATDVVEFTTSGLSYVAATLENLEDVGVYLPSPGQTLVWDGTQWVNGGLYLDGLLDVALSSPLTAGEGLVWDGAQWTNQPSASSIATLTDVQLSSPLSDGDALIWDDAAQAWVNGAGGGGGSGVTINYYDAHDPAKMALFFCDFVGNEVATWSIYGATGGYVWYHDAVRVDGRPGIAVAGSGTSASSSAAVIRHTSSMFTVDRANTRVPSGTDELSLEWCGKFSTIAQSTGYMRFGLVNNVSTYNDCVYVDAAANTVKLWCVSGGTGSSATFSTLPADDTFCHIEIRATTTAVKAYLNGQLVATVTTNIPTAGLDIVIQAGNLSSNVDRVITTDYVRLKTIYATPRATPQPYTQVQYAIVGDNLTHPDAPPPSPDSMDDEFEGSTLASKWVWRNQGTSTATVQAGALVIKPQGTAGVNSLRILEQTVSGSFKVRAKVTHVNNGTVAGTGLCFINNSTGKIYSFYPVSNGGSSAFAIDRFTNATTYSGASILGDTGLAGYGAATLPIYLELEYDGTTLYFRASANGADGTFRTMASEAAATWLGTPDRVGLVTNAPIASPDVYATFDWFRRIGATYASGTLAVNARLEPTNVNLTPDTHPTPANALDDEFEGTALDSKWVQQYVSGTITPTVARGSLVLTATANNSRRAWTQPVSGTFKFRMKLTLEAGYRADRALGWLLYNVANNKQLYFLLNTSGAGAARWLVVRETNWGSASYPYAPSVSDWRIMTPQYLEVESDGTTIYFRQSQTGVDGSFLTYHSETIATHLVAAPDQIGFSYSCGGGTTGDTGIIDWFRRIS